MNENARLPGWVAYAICPNRSRAPIEAETRRDWYLLGFLLVLAALNFLVGNPYMFLAVAGATAIRLAYLRTALMWLDRHGAWSWLPDLPPTRPEIWHQRLWFRPRIFWLVVIWLVIAASVVRIWLALR